MKEQDVKYIISTHGTKGDIIPFIGLALELKKRESDVIFFVNEEFTDILEINNLSFVSTGSRQQFRDFHNDNRVWDNRKDPLEFGFEIIIRTTIETSLKSTIDEFQKFGSKDQLCVIGIEPNFNGALWAAQILGLKRVLIFLWPSCIDSDQSPPAPRKWLIPHWFSDNMRFSFLKTLRNRRHRRTKSRKYFKQLNQMRSDIGLEKLDNLSNNHIFKSSGIKIGLFPSWFGLPATDWPSDFNIIGFPERNEPRIRNWKIFDDFVEKFGNPILFTSGTGVFNTESIFREGEKACNILKRPGVFVGGSLPNNVGSEPHFLHLQHIDGHPQ